MMRQLCVVVLFVLGLLGCVVGCASPPPVGERGEEPIVAEQSQREEAPPVDAAPELTPEPEPEPEPEPAPDPQDLSLKSLKVEHKAKDEVRFVMTLCSRNEAQVASLALFLNMSPAPRCPLRKDAEPMVSANTSIPAGACKTLTIPYKGLPDGSYWVTAFLDSECQIDEEDESNNLQHEIFTVRKQPLPPVRSRFQLSADQPLPSARFAADVSGDGKTDWIIVDDKKLYITNLEKTFNGHLYAMVSSPIKRILAGRFLESGKDTLCILTQNAAFVCRHMHQKHGTLDPIGPPTSLIAQEDKVAVGDFDGDGLDELLVFHAVFQKYSLYQWSVKDKKFEAVESFEPGALDETRSWKSRQLWVGQFADRQGDARRDDLLLYNSDQNLLVRLDAQLAPAGQVTFVKRLSIRDLLQAGELPSLAQLDPSEPSRHQLVLRDQTTGRLRAFSLQSPQSDTRPKPLSLPLDTLVLGPNTILLWIKASSAPDDHPANALHDALIIDPTNKRISRFDHQGTTTNPFRESFTQAMIDLDADPDEDGLKTYIELGGMDANNDGISDNPLHAHGASPFVPDIFVEVDFMDVPPGKTEDLRMKPESVKLAIETMKAKGIQLHIDVDDKIPYKPHMSDTGTYFSWTRDFDPIKNKYFDRSRWSTYHYAVFGSKYKSNNSSGLSRGIGGSDFIVTLGSWGSSPGTLQQQVGTFLHELGHNLGLKHGSMDGINHKPNNISIMNYLFQFIGYRKNGQILFFFSEIKCLDLDETNLNESLGVQCPGVTDVYETRGTGFNNKPINAPIDFNRDRKIETSVSIDINRDNYTTKRLSGSVDEYKLLRFKVGLIGSDNIGTQRLMPNYKPLETLSQDDELTEELAKQLYPNP